MQFWDASTGMVLSEFKGHTDRVTCCAIANTGRLIVTSSEDNTVKVCTHRQTDRQTDRVTCCAIAIATCVCEGSNPRFASSVNAPTLGIS